MRTTFVTAVPLAIAWLLSIGEVRHFHKMTKHYCSILTLALTILFVLVVSTTVATHVNICTVSQVPSEILKYYDFSNLTIC